MSEFSKVPILSNPYRQLHLHPQLIETLSPADLAKVARAAAKSLLEILHPSRNENAHEETIKKNNHERALVQDAIEQLRVPERARKAAREYRGLTLQDEVDLVAEHVEEKKELLQKTRSALTDFLVARIFAPAEENLLKQRNIKFTVLDVLGKANFFQKNNPLIDKLYTREVSIDAQGKIVGGIKPFFANEPLKRPVAILTVNGEDLSERVLEAILRRTGLTVLPPPRSIADYSKGEPTIQPWQEFTSTLAAQEIKKLTYHESGDLVAQFSVKYAKPSDEQQSYLITASAIPQSLVIEKAGRPTYREIYYIEGLITDFSSIEVEKGTTNKSVSRKKSSVKQAAEQEEPAETRSTTKRTRKK